MFYDSRAAFEGPRIYRSSLVHKRHLKNVRKDTDKERYNGLGVVGNGELGVVSCSLQCAMFMAFFVASPKMACFPVL